MSLIKCPECRRKISDKADACPKCGFPLGEDSEICEKDNKSTMLINEIIVSPIMNLTKKIKRCISNTIDSIVHSFHNFTKSYKDNLTVLRIVLAFTMCFLPSAFSLITMAMFAKEMMNIYITIPIALLLALLSAVFVLTDWYVARLNTTFYLVMSVVLSLAKEPRTELSTLLCVFFAIETFVYVYFNPLKRN